MITDTPTAHRPIAPNDNSLFQTPSEIIANYSKGWGWFIPLLAFDPSLTWIILAITAPYMGHHSVAWLNLDFLII